MNTYLCIYNGKKTEICADTIYQAKQKAITYFKPRKSQQHMVIVELVEINGKPYIHSTSEL